MDTSLLDTVDRSCRHLEMTAREMGVALTVEMKSVGLLEEILAALTEIGANEEVMRGATFMVGVYLGEILRGLADGEWHVSANGEMLLTLGRTTYSPVVKARKFALHPSEGDSLTFFASVAVSGNGA